MGFQSLPCRMTITRGAQKFHIDIHRQSLTFTANHPKYHVTTSKATPFDFFKYHGCFLWKGAFSFKPKVGQFWSDGRTHVYIICICYNHHTTTTDQPYQSHPWHPQTPESAYEWPKVMVLVSSAHHLPPQHVLTDQQCRPLARPRVKLSAVALDVPHQDRRSITSRSRGPMDQLFNPPIAQNQFFFAWACKIPRLIQGLIHWKPWVCFPSMPWHISKTPQDLAAPPICSALWRSCTKTSVANCKEGTRGGTAAETAGKTPKRKKNKN